MNGHNGRVAAAGDKLLDRLRAAIGVLEGDAFRHEGMQATLDVFDDLAAQHGEAEADRVRGVVIDILAKAMVELKREANDVD